MPDFIGEDVNAPGYIGTQSYVPPRQNPRTIRANHHLKTIDIGQGQRKTPCYRFNDVLEFAYTVGFLGFGPSNTQYIAGGGHKGGPLVIVESVGFFLEEDGTTSSHFAIGDASPENCGALTGAAFPRMADTRSKGRVLRFAMGLDALMADELGPDEDESPKALTSSKPSYTQTSSNSNAPTNSSATGSGSRPTNDPSKYPPKNAPDSETGYICEECNVVIMGSDKYEPGMKAFFSMRNHGKILCWNHQQSAPRVV
jgi:hypothetical protein